MFSDRKEPVPVRINGYGDHLIYNALAAAAVGKLMDVPAEAICKGLEQFVPVHGRMTVVRTRAGFNVVDDTYNANPDSMRAAIKTVQGLRGRKRGFLIFGDMYELGDRAASMHQTVGRWAAESGPAMLLAVGDFAKAVAEGAVDAGMAKSRIITGTKEKVIKALADSVQSGDWILVKGSRAMAMETVVSAILETGGGAAGMPEG